MAKRRVSKKGKKRLTILVIILMIIGVCGGTIFTYLNQEKNTEETTNGTSSKKNPVSKPKLKIIDEDSDERPIAVMINNHSIAAKNHAGLQDAYLTYEIIVEGGLTRLMAIFKDKDTARIGSVRSSRHYFLDYALENDALYTHFGWSERAKSDISTLGINNINGLYDSGFWRDKTLNVAYEHTAFTSIEGIKKVANSYGYRMTSKKDTLLNYSIKSVDMENIENAQVANYVNIVYSSYQKTSYEYDAENKVYKRFMNGSAHTDAVTKEQYTVKNIITYQVYNYSFDSYGRQDLENIGTGTGYYISEGYAIPITWEKKDRSSQTTYYYETGKELKVNDGNTYIQIQPKNQTLEITE